MAEDDWDVDEDYDAIWVCSRETYTISNFVRCVLGEAI
jgi:hypothetical protein